MGVETETEAALLIPEGEGAGDGDSRCCEREPRRFIDDAKVGEMREEEGGRESGAGEYPRVELATLEAIELRRGLKIGD